MPTITQRIALDGGEEIRRQFKAMGAAGKAALEMIDKAGLATAQSLDRIVGSVARVERSFIALNASASAFSGSLGRAGAAFGSFEGAILRSVRNIGLLTAAVGGAAVGFGALVKNAADAADNIGEQAAGLGITTDRLQELGAAATDSGVDAETFGRGLGSLAKNIKEDAEKQLKAAAEHVLSLGRTFPRTAAGARAFAEEVGRTAVRLQAINNAAGRGETDLGRLGIATLDAAGNMRNVDDVFLDVADAIAKLPAGTEKSALAMELFGAKIGRRFIDLLDKGSKGILELGKQFAALKFTPGEIQIGDDFAKQFGILSLVATRAQQKLALLFGPALTDLMGAFAEKLLSNFGDVQAGLKNVVEQGIKPVIADLITLISGQQTPIRTDWVRNLPANFEKAGKVIGQAVGIIGAAFGALRVAAASIAGVINNIFGTQISGDALLLAAAVLKVTGLLGLLTQGFVLAGAAALVFVRTMSLAAGAVRLLLAGIAAFAAIANPFATLIVGAGLLVAAYVLASDEVKATVNKLFVDLVLMAQEGASAVGQAVASGLTNELGKLSIGSVFQAMFNDLAAFGESVVDNGKIIGLRLAQGIASQLALLGKFIGGADYFVGLSQSFGKAADDIAAKAKELGLEITGQLGESGEQAAETFLEKFQRIFKEGKAIGLGADTKGLDEAAGKTSTLDAMLKRLGITTDSAKSKLEQLGQSGKLALDTVRDAAEDAAQKIRDLNIQAASQAADLRDEMGRLERERDKLLRSGKDTTEVDERLLTLRRKMREQEDARRRSVEAAAVAADKAEDQASLAAKKQQQSARQASVAERDRLDVMEAQTRERLRQQSLDADRFRGIPLGGDTLAPTPGQPPAAKPGAAGAAGAIDTAAINTALAQVGTIAQQAAVGLQALTALDFAGLSSAFQRVTTAVQQLATDLQGKVSSALQSLTTAADSAAQALQKIQAGGDMQELAGGGMIRGPGTATSDSVLARLSRGEYVVRAAAVRKYGTGLLSALNGMRIPRPTGFNMGGLVENMSRTLSAAMIPGFAAGGLAELPGRGSGGRPIALTINAGGERQTFRVWADEQVADSVVRYATKRQVASAGRKSGAFG